MAVLLAVKAALEGIEAESWQVEIALALASAMDESPNASTAKELQSLMADLGASARPVEKVSVQDELKRKRDERRALAASGS